jgi:hypothetical protein
MSVCSDTCRSLRNLKRFTLITFLSSAKSTSTFFCSRHERQYASVPLSSCVRCRAGSWQALCEQTDPRNAIAVVVPLKPGRNAVYFSGHAERWVEP